ncbi:MAG: hypothetical protein HGB12_07715 [Bacteroidetes bacterium]|nr:hypothetical protein [Bacteroidota bacterium]
MISCKVKNSLRYHSCILLMLLYCSLLLHTAYSQSGIAFDAATANSQSNTSSVTFSHTCSSGSNRILFVFGWCRSMGVSSVKYNNVAMTEIGSEIQNPDYYPDHIFLFYLINPASGANNVVVTYNSSNYQCVGAVSYTGAKQSGQPDAWADYSGTTASDGSYATSLTTIANNSWTVMVGMDERGDIAPGTGTTKRLSATNSIFCDLNGPITPAGSTSMSTICTVNPLANVPTVHKMASFAPITPPASAVVDWNNSNVQEITLSANRYFTFTNGKSGCIYTLIIKQDNTGARTVTWPTEVKWSGNTVPTLSTAADAVDIVKFVFDGTKYLVISTTLNIPY